MMENQVGNKNEQIKRDMIKKEIDDLDTKKKRFLYNVKMEFLF